MDSVLGDLGNLKKSLSFREANTDTTGLVGCFKKIENFFSYNQGFFYNLKMTVEICRNFCSRHVYSWLKIGVECTCSDTLEDLHRIEKSLCDVNCRGNRDQVCGGSKDDLFGIYYSKIKGVGPHKLNLIRSDRVYEAILKTTTISTSKLTRSIGSRPNITNFKNDSVQIVSICGIEKGSPCYILPIYVTIGGYKSDWIVLTGLSIFFVLFLFLLVCFQQELKCMLACIFKRIFDFAVRRSDKKVKEVVQPE